LALPPTKQARDANLDSLLTAVTQWSQQEIQRLDNETKYLRAILQGRGISDTGSKNLAKASSLVNAEIDEFLRFG